MSLSKTLHLLCLVLVQPRKMSGHDSKIVDLDVKPKLKQINWISMTIVVYVISGLIILDFSIDMHNIQ